ncbi:MAG TPA: zinc ribbon domain-containing protein [Anaerolineae bacterium]
MTRRKLFTGAMMLCALWAMFAAAPRAFAQDPNRLSQLKISVWPEYDQPTVLVMLDGTLADATNLPRQVAVLIPSSAKLQVTTFANADGSFAAEQVSQSTNQNDGFTRVTFSIQTAAYHVEYYDDLLRGAPDKSMDYGFKAAAPVDQATLEVQQPFKATNFSATPPTQSTRTDAQGFTYLISQFSNLSAGQVITTQVKYVKSDPALSISALPTAPAPITTPAPAAVPVPASPWNNIFILVAVVLLGLVGVIGYFVLQQRARAPALASSRGGGRRGRERGGKPREAAAYCTQCGHGLSSDDLFCPRCGTKRRPVG